MPRIRAVIAFVFTLAVGSAAANNPQASPTDHLVHLLHDRLALAYDVAKAKHNSGAPVEDLRRERVVIDNAVKQANVLGISAAGITPEMVRRLFVAQIDASKVAQAEFVGRWQGHPKFADAPDLARQIRPRLDALTTEIIAAFVSTESDRHSTRFKARLASAIRRWSFRGHHAVEFRAAWKVAVGPLVLPRRR